MSENVVMDHNDTPKNDLNATQALEVDAICVRFEQQLKADKQPTIEDSLGANTEPIRSRLLEQLLLLELDHLGAQDATPDVEDYTKRFPAHEALVRQVFADSSPRQTAGSPRTGQMIGHYQLARKLGAGGMGEVYLAKDTRLERQVAIKLLPLDLASDPARRQRFLTEAKSASALNHANVCIIYEVGETDDQRPFIAMEFVEGRTLDELIRDENLEIAQIVEIGTQIADALAAAQEKRIVHRDIKPANISINERGRIKVLDFGLAKRLVDLDEVDGTVSLQTQSGTVLGTPAYMSPEQALGKQLDHRTDIFSLGVVLYELVTGQPPFQGTSFGDLIHKIVHVQPEAIARFNYNVTPELDNMIRKCLQKAPERRYQSAAELLVDFRNIGRDLGSDADSIILGPSGVDDTTALTGKGASTVEEVKDSDIFISCAQLDDQPISPGKQGWITRLQQNLKVRLEQLSGDSVKIHTRPLPPGPAAIDEAVIEHLPNVKTLVSVISPPFAKSEGCRREVEEFCEKTKQSGQFWVEDKPRLFKVVKTPVDDHEIPGRLREVFQQLMSFEFFERDPETGRFREFDEAFGEAAQQQYYERVYDLAYDIVQVLKHQTASADPQNGQGAPDGLRIYLAETTSDIQADRDRLRRELVEQGHTVLPDRPLPLVASELEDAVHGYLEHADLAIHMVGGRYGMVPEDSDRSVVVLQNAFASRRSAESNLDRLIWMQRGIEPCDRRQKDFICQLVEDEHTHRGAEVIQDTLENLKEVIESKWEAAKRKSQAAAAPTVATDVARVYLICDQQDEADVEALEDYLYEQGIEVSLPDFEQDEETVSQIHWQNLQDCDAALVYYGAGSKSWVDIKLRDLIKAVGYRNGLPLHHQAVYVAPPIDRRKERFKSLSAEVIRQPGDSFDPGVLASFTDRVKEARQAAS